MIPHDETVCNTLTPPSVTSVQHPHPSAATSVQHNTLHTRPLQRLCNTHTHLLQPPWVGVVVVDQGERVMHAIKLGCGKEGQIKCG